MVRESFIRDLPMITALVPYYVVGILATLAAAGVGFSLTLRYGKSMPCWLLVIALIFPAYLFVAQYLKFQSLHMYADFSHWLQMAFNISNRWALESLNADFLIPGIQRYLSVHFVPLFYFFGAAYKIFPFPETLLVLNGILMLSSAVPMYLLAKRLVGRYFGLVAAVLLLWYPTFQYITIYEFEMLRFSIPTILWMLYFWEARRMLPFAIALVAALLVREEVSLVIAFFGLSVFLFEKERLTGLVIAGVSLTYFAVVVTVIMGAFSPAEHYTYVAITGFSGFGSTPFEVVRNVFLHPLSAIARVFSIIKWANVVMYFVPLLFVPLLAPAVLMSALPNFGVSLLSNSVTNSSYMLYYLAPSIPFLFYALLKAWPRIIGLFSWSITAATGDRLPMALSTAMLAGMMVVNFFFGPSPISLQFWSKNTRPAPFRTHDYHWSAYRVTDHHRKTDALARLIPDSAIVSAEQFLAPKLYQKRGMMIFPQTVSADGKYQAEYVFIDKSNPLKTGVATVPESWDGLREHPQTYYDAIEGDPQQWDFIREDGGYFIYRRKPIMHW